MSAELTAGELLTDEERLYRARVHRLGTAPDDECLRYRLLPAAEEEVDVRFVLSGQA